MMGIGGDRHLRMYEPARFTLSTSHGYFWDVEELRHQEHLRRVSHAQYLYRHRHDSDEAAGLYRDFMEEQNEWMDGQERMKEIELSLSVKAYKQRASRWEEEWRRLEEGGNVEDILKQRSRTNLLMTVPFHQEFMDISSEESSAKGFSDLVMSPRNISSLDLPSPLLSLPSPLPQLVCSRNKAKQVDRSQQTKIYKIEDTIGTSRVQELGAPEDTYEQKEESEILDTSQGSEGTSISYSRQPEPRSRPMKLLCPSSEGVRGSRSTPTNLQLQSSARPKQLERSAGSSAAQSPSLSLSSNHSGSFLAISRSHGRKERNYRLSLTNGEVIRIISHKTQGKNFIYLISWRLQNSIMPPVECWVRAIDFLGSSKRAIIEDYHFRNNLGAVRWPRDSRRQLRTSTSFGVREIMSALDERKKILLQRGVSESETSRELNEERWKIRDDWQRAGRGWGSAIMIVEDRKKAWRIADSAIREKEIIVPSEEKGVPERTPGVNSSDNTPMAQTVRVTDFETRSSLKVNTSGSNSLRDDMLSQSEIQDRSRPSLRDVSNSDYDSPKSGDWKQRNGFKGTSEDEREWREHFILDPEISGTLELSMNNVRSGLSRVKSTIRNVPGTLDLGLTRTKTLPEARQKVAHHQVLPQQKHQEPAQVVGFTSPVPTKSSVSDAQSYLKAQRKSLLSRMLSREPFRREHHKHYRDDCSLHAKPREGIREPLVFIETATEPFESSEDRPLRSRSNQSVTASLSSYISFDGAIPEMKMPGRKSWTKALWDKFSYLLVSSSRNPSSGRRAMVPEEPLLPSVSIPTFEAASRGSQVRTHHTKGSSKQQWPRKDPNIPPKKVTVPPNAFHEPYERGKLQKWCSAGPPLPESLLVETAASRTASWAASILPPLRRSKSEEPRKGRWIPSPIEVQEVVTGTIFAPSETSTGEITDTSQLSLEIYTRRNGPSNGKNHDGKAWGVNKGKSKARVGMDYSPISMQSAPLTRSFSKEEYLAKREAEKQVQRDKAVARTKIMVKRRKEKADQYANDLKRLEDLRSKKACPLSKWKKSNQLELDLLRMKLGIRLDKRTSGKGVVADLQILKDSLLPDAVITRTQQKGGSPA